MRHRSGSIALAAVAAAALALPLAGCGKEKPKIPRDNARALVALLGTAERQSDAHACVTVSRTISSLQTRVEGLPSRTDSDIRDSLRDGIARLRTLVAAECATEEPKPKEPDTSGDTSSDTSTEAPSTTTTTEEPPSTTEPPPTTAPTPPPSGGSPPDDSKGNGKKKGKKR